MKLLELGLEWVAEGRAVAVATVARAVGSTPRHPGTKMLVTDAGEIAGTVGGGRVEQEVTLAAARVAAGAASVVVEHHLVRDLAMCCGGSMTVLIQPLAPSAATIAEAIEAVSARRPVTTISSIVGPVEVREGAGAKVSWDGERLVEPHWPRDRVILFGAGHVARALGPLASGVGFDVILCDDNETGALDSAHHWSAGAVESFDLYDVRKQLGGLGRGDFALILTRDHAVDQRILEELLPHAGDLEYVGLIGSPGKIGRFRKRLFAKGLADDESWARLRAPIGFDIGAETPEEIAIAVVAELIKERAELHRARR